MNFQDNLEKVGDLYVVLSFIRIREITLYFLHGTLKFFYFIIFIQTVRNFENKNACKLLQKV